MSFYEAANLLFDSPLAEFGLGNCWDLSIYLAVGECNLSVGERA